MTGALLVLLGGAVGAPLRYLVDRALRRRLGDGFPVGILVVNVVGSLVLGTLVGVSASAGLPDGVVLLLGTGLCGALTTFSSFGHDTVRLVEQGDVVRAGLNVAGNVVLGLAAAVAGVALGSV